MQKTAGNTYMGAWIWLASIAILTGVFAGFALDGINGGFNTVVFLLVTLASAVLYLPVVMAFWIFGTYAHSITTQLEAVQADLAAMRADRDAAPVPVEASSIE